MINKKAERFINLIYSILKLVKEATRYQGAFASLSIGAPLLTSDQDSRIVADALAASTAAYDDGATAICLMGHGTEAAANEVYERMQKELAGSGRANYFFGTVEAAPTVDKVLSPVKAGNYKRVLFAANDDRRRRPRQ